MRKLTGIIAIFALSFVMFSCETESTAEETGLYQSVDESATERDVHYEEERTEDDV